MERKVLSRINKGGSLSGARSIDGMLLTGLNDPAGYVWTFRVKDADDATCGVASVVSDADRRSNPSSVHANCLPRWRKSDPDSCSQKGQILSGDTIGPWPDGTRSADS
ncbi:MAG: hypothetical protein U0487_00670 [Patescibacteria group bacterium]